LQVEESQGEPGCGRVRCNALLGAATESVATATMRLSGAWVCSALGRGGARTLRVERTLAPEGEDATKLPR